MSHFRNGLLVSLISMCDLALAEQVSLDLNWKAGHCRIPINFDQSYSLFQLRDFPHPTLPACRGRWTLPQQIVVPLYPIRDGIVSEGSWRSVETIGEYSVTGCIRIQKTREQYILYAGISSTTLSSNECPLETLQASAANFQEFNTLEVHDRTVLGGSKVLYSSMSFGPLK